MKWIKAISYLATIAGGLYAAWQLYKLFTGAAIVPRGAKQKDLEK